ncbi:hypothetical protein HY772_09305 [Candidatus Woesearchaeota archaeon]|nr:hypothetical protein [Candidatus Woesearchaeota archaeon]
MHKGHYYLVLCLLAAMLSDCAGHSRLEHLKQDYTKTISLVVGPMKDSNYFVTVELAGMPEMVKPSFLVLQNQWASVRVTETCSAPEQSHYDIKLLLDDEVITETVEGWGILLKVKVVPYPDSDKVRVKGFILRVNREEKRIYPFSVDCILNQRTIIFEERLRYVTHQ